MRFTLFRYGAFLFLSIYSILLHGQPVPHYLESLTAFDGLSSNFVTDVCTDNNGYLWIATRHGLNRYDGTEIVQYFSEKNKNSLSSNILVRLVPVDSFHIAIATNHGLTILDTRDFTFRRMMFSSDSSMESVDNQIVYMEKDEEGNLWLSTPSCIYRLDKHLRLRRIFRSGFTMKDLADSRLIYAYKIIPLSTGEVLFWLTTGVHIWRPGTDSLVRVDQLPGCKWAFLQGSSYFQAFNASKDYLVYIDYFDNELEIYDSRTGEKASCPMAIRKEHSSVFITHVSALGNGWIALALDRGGVAYARIKHWETKFLVSGCDSIYLADRVLGKWVNDRENNQWITTETKGLIKISHIRQLFKTRYLRKGHTSGTSEFEIMSFFRVKNQLFIGSYGNGFYIWDRTSDKISHHSARYGRGSENMVWNFSRHSDDTLWIGTQQGIIWYNIKRQTIGRLPQVHPAILDSFPITAQYRDSGGLLWIGVGAGHGVCVYDPVKNSFRVFPHSKKGYPYHYPMAMMEDAEGDLWFISDATPQLVKWDRKENRFEKVIIPLLKGKPYVQTGGFYLDRAKGLIWYGVTSVGLICYHIKTGEVKTFGRSRGVSTDLINAIREDEKGVLWLSTSQGITSFDPNREMFINYSYRDGLPATYFSSRMYFDPFSFRMYAGAPGRVVYFSPFEFHIKRKPMKIALTGLKVNDHPVSISKNRHLRLSWRDNNIFLSFTGINLTNGNENRYAYRMGMDDTGWIDIHEKRQLYFANLKPGDYIFTIRGARKGESWSPVTDSIEMTIAPPFVRTIWFYLLCLVVTGGAIYAWYRYRLRQLHQMEIVRTRISHDLHDDIGSRLTNISLLSQLARQKNQAEAQKEIYFNRIQQESEAISQSMREIIWNVNPENDSMEEAMPRMLRYASGLLENKKISIRASIPDMDGIKIDMEKRRDMFLIFKEAIHNIVKHSEAGQAVISAEKGPRTFWLTIEDFGKGFEMNTLAYKNGLHYMQQRAQKHRWKLTIESRLQKGTKIRLEIKIT